MPRETRDEPVTRPVDEPSAVDASATIPGVKAPEVIATHANTDFDAFASLLAARRLYPDAVVAIQGTLNRNVREFYRLHADELEAVDASRLDLAAIRRLVVVETTSAFVGWTRRTIAAQTRAR